MEKQCAGCGKIFTDDKPRPMDPHGTGPVSGTIHGQCPECEKAMFRSKAPEAPKPAPAAVAAKPAPAAPAAQKPPAPVEKA